jgi:type II secretory pathway pseudopilin PulG
MKQHKMAFTLVELAVILAVIAIVATMLLPALAATQTKSQKVACLNNLKQIGLAFRLWETDNSGQYPMAISTSQGGAAEYLSHSSGGSTPTPATKVLCPGMVYMVMSNELSKPKISFCPADNIHVRAATNFTFQDLLGIAFTPGASGLTTAQPGEPAGSGGSKISYFVNGDLAAGIPQDVLAGDVNIGSFNANTPAAAAGYRFGGSAGAETCSAAANGVTSVGITPAAYNGTPWWAWTPNDFHQKSGNLLMGDGSCLSTTVGGLHTILGHSTNSAPAEAINFMP